MAFNLQPYPRVINKLFVEKVNRGYPSKQKYPQYFLNGENEATFVVYKKVFMQQLIFTEHSKGVRNHVRCLNKLSFWIFTKIQWISYFSHSQFYRWLNWKACIVGQWVELTPVTSASHTHAGSNPGFTIASPAARRLPKYWDSCQPHGQSR